MDVRVGAEAIETTLTVAIVSPIVSVVKGIISSTVVSQGPSLAPSIISVSGHSISAIAPDLNSMLGGTAVAA